MKKYALSLLGLISISSCIHAQDQEIDTPVSITPPSSLTTTQGQIEVKQDGTTVSISKVPSSPLANTITSVNKPIIQEKETPKAEPADLKAQVSDIANSLSQADLDYLKAVNDNEKRSSIESKITNNEVISKDELKILRQKNPNY